MRPIRIRRLYSFLLILAFLVAGIKSDGNAREESASNKYWAVSLDFAEKGTVLPRMSHPVVHIDSTGLAALDVTIFHVREGDVHNYLWDMKMLPSQAEPVWHQRIDIAAVPGEQAVSPIDMLQAIGPLKTGLYCVKVNDAGPYGSHRLFASHCYAVSNLGLQAFVARDGVMAQVRLLSTLAPAPGVEVALIGADNRELTRARSDNEGNVHFTVPTDDQIVSPRPVALYAYGADGEFTPLELSDFHAVPARARAWLEIEKQGRPGDPVKGLVLVRDAEGKAVSAEGLYVTLQHKFTGVAAAQNLVDGGGGAYSFTLPYPVGPHPASVQNNEWSVVLYGTDNKPIADFALDGTPEADKTNGPAPTPALGSFILSPGRRSFQPGAPADIFVQPPFDANVNFVVATDTVTATLNQQIGKDGAAAQVPMPASASGAYVIASAFAFVPTDSNNTGKIDYRLATTWLDADKGDKRLGVKLDAPETAAPGATVNVGVSLTNADSQAGPAFVSLAVFSADASALPDPLNYFLGQTPLALAIDTTYAQAEALVKSSAAAPRVPFMPLILTQPVAVDGDGKAVLPIVLPSTAGKLELYVISWSGTRLGLGGSELTLTGKPAAQAAKPAATPEASWHTDIIPAGATKKLNLRAAYISAAPILAAPVAVDSSGHATFIDVNDPDTGKLSNAVLAATLMPLQGMPALQTAYILQKLAALHTAYPKDASMPLFDQVARLTEMPNIPKDQAVFAAYIALATGTKDKREIGAFLSTDVRPVTTPLGHAALAALDALAGDKENAAKETHAALAAGDYGNDKLFTLLLLNDAGQPIPEAELKTLAARYPIGSTRDPLTMLALKLAAGIPPADAAPYKIRLNGQDATANGYLSLQVGAEPKPLTLDNPNQAPLYLIQR